MSSPAPRIEIRGSRRELWIGADWQGAYDPRRPTQTGRGWYWPLMAKVASAYLRERTRPELGRGDAAGSSRPGPGARGPGSGGATGALFLGLGAATVPRLLARKFPELPMTAVELSPRVVKLCREFLDPPRALRIVRADAARFVRKRGAQFPLIFEDVFGAATQMEFSRASGLDANYFRALWRNRLAPGGLLLVNVFADEEFAPGRDKLRATLSEFGRVRVFTPEYGANEVWALIKPAR